MKMGMPELSLEPFGIYGSTSLEAQILRDEDDLHAPGMAVMPRYHDVAAHAALAVAFAADSRELARRIGMEARGVWRACGGLHAFDCRIDIGADLVHSYEHDNLLGAEEQAGEPVRVTIYVDELALSRDSVGAHEEAVARKM